MVLLERRHCTHCPPQVTMITCMDWNMQYKQKKKVDFDGVRAAPSSGHAAVQQLSPRYLGSTEYSKLNIWLGNQAFKSVASAESVYRWHMTNISVNDSMRVTSTNWGDWFESLLLLLKKTQPSIWNGITWSRSAQGCLLGCWKCTLNIHFNDKSRIMFEFVFLHFLLQPIWMCFTLVTTFVNVKCATTTKSSDVCYDISVHLSWSKTAFHLLRGHKHSASRIECDIRKQGSLRTVIQKNQYNKYSDI